MPTPYERAVLFYAWGSTGGRLLPDYTPEQVAASFPISSLWLLPESKKAASTATEVRPDGIVAYVPDGTATALITLTKPGQVDPTDTYHETILKKLQLPHDDNPPNTPSAIEPFDFQPAIKLAEQSGLPLVGVMFFREIAKTEQFITLLLYMNILPPHIALAFIQKNVGEVYQARKRNSWPASSHKN